MRPLRRSSPWLVVAPLLLLALTLRLWALQADHGDAVVQVGLECHGDTCLASLDGAPPLQVNAPYRQGHVGAYVFHPFERPMETRFRRLSFRSGSSVADLSLTDSVGPPPYAGGPGWTIEPGEGLTHRGNEGDRAVAIFETDEAADFTLQLELDRAVDAGLIFRAADADNGMLFIVRTEYNDAFFCRLTDGQVGPIEAIMPLRELRPGRELLRVSGLVSEIVLISIALLALLRLLASRLPVIRPRVEWPANLLQRDEPPRGWLPTLFVATVLLLSAVAILGLGAVSHVDDEAAYLFQAKIFASGGLWVAPPPAPGFFDHEHMIVGAERWFAKYPPLYPLLLALGVLAGVPWLVNPVLGALTALATYLLARELADWRWGIASWLLLISSPFFVIMGGTMMSHMTAALLVTTSVYQLLRGMRESSGRRLALSGLALGLAVFCRPFTALLAAVAAGGYLAWSLARGPRRREVLRLGATLVLIVALLAVGFVGWNRMMTGPSDGPSNLYAAYDGTDTLGFGPDKGRGWWMSWGSWGHTPAKALRSTQMYLDYTSNHLLGWPLRLSLALVPAALLMARRRDARSLLLALFALLVVGHMGYWATQHISYGARYWFAAVPALIVLSTLGLRWAVTPAASQGRTAATPPAVPLGALCGVALVLGLVAWNATTYFPLRWRELPAYGGVTADLRRETVRRGLDHAVVFVWTEGVRFNEGFSLNDPRLRYGPIFARDLGPQNRRLMMQYPDRRAYRWTRDKRLVSLTSHAVRARNDRIPTHDPGETQ